MKYETSSSAKLFTYYTFKIHKNEVNHFLAYERNIPFK